MSDPEKAKRRADGYDRLASLMGEVDDVAIFRRFGALSAEDLLYRQAELAELEEDLRHYQQEDKDAGDPERARYNLNWGKLRDSDGAQLQTILEIRTKLKDYRKTDTRLKLKNEAHGGDRRSTHPPPKSAGTWHSPATSGGGPERLHEQPRKG